MNALHDVLAERAIAAAAWDDAEGRETGDGFFTYRPADETDVVYVGIGGSDGSYQVAGWDADRLRAVAALILAEAQHLEDRARAVQPLGASSVPSREEYEHALAVLAGSRGTEDFDVEYSASERETAAAWIAQYEAANR